MTPRLSEMLLAVRDRLTRAGYVGEKAPKRVVLVGGGALIPGARDLAAEVLRLPVRVGRPFELCGFDHGEAGPAYAVAAGLLRHRLDNPTLDDVEDSYQPTLAHAAMLMRSTASNAWNWLRENF